MGNSDPQAADNGRQSRLLTTLEGLFAIPTTDLKRGLTQASDIIVRVLRADKADVFLYESSSATLVAFGTSDTPMGRHQIQLGLNRLAIANGGKSVGVYQTGTPYHSGHVDQDVDQLRGIRLDLGVRSALVVPLIIEGTCRGIIEVDSAAPDWFSSDDATFLLAAAHWVGTVYQRAELTERLTHEAAEQSRRLVADELIAILAHDLRAPLTPIQGYLAMIMEEANREGHRQYRTFAQRAQRGVDRLLRMIDDILDATRLEHGIFIVKPDVVDLPVLVHQTAQILQTGDHPLDVQAMDSLIVECEPNRIRQVVENLISNAQRYTPEGTPVMVEVACEHKGQKAWAVLTVRDTGPGISPDLLPTLFTQDMRGRSKTGLGLGLYLAHGIATVHNGTLTVESAVGKGTAFRLALPIPPDLC